MTHGETNPTDQNYYWDANFGKWLRKTGGPNGGANMSLAQAMSGLDQTQSQQDATSQILAQTFAPSGGGPPLSPPGGGLASTAEGSQQGQMGMPTQPETHTQQGAGMRLEKNGEVYFKTDPGEIGRLLQQGYQVRDGNDPNGQLYTPKSYQGGYLVKSGDYWVPVDTLLNGRMTQAQKDALTQGGFQIDPGVEVIGGGSTGNTGTGGTGGTTGGTTSGGVNASPLGGSLAEMLKDLMQRSLNQGAAGQNALSGIVDSLKQNAQFNQAQTEKAGAGRDSLVSALLGGSFNTSGGFDPNGQGLLGGYNKVISKMDQGLDPLTMASLNQQAIEGPQRDYQGQVETLKTALAGRGAYGGGDTPGSLGDIVRGYSPLLTARDTTRQGLMQQNAFANQAQKNTNLSAGLSALGGESSALGTVGSLYNPNAFANTTSNSLANALSGVNASNLTGFQGINSAGNLAGTLNDTSTGSLGSLLKASLLGTGVNALTTPLGNSKKTILGSLLGLIPGLGGGGSPGAPDTKSALENYLDNTVGANWRDSINSDQVEFLLSQAGNSKTPQ